jgi:NAD(P)-dependent dehydrogenase (short-subunit alcohol dehydrogenase family)
MKLATDPSSGVYATALDEYHASKAALNIITIQIHKRLHSCGLRVFAFWPGFARSNLMGEDEHLGIRWSLVEGFCGLCLGRGVDGGWDAGLSSSDS